MENHQLTELLQPIKGLVFSEPYPESYSKFLARTYELLSRVVAFGTHVISWCDAKDGRRDRVVAILLLRHLLEQLDGIAGLVRGGRVNTCELQLRSILEAMLGLEYLLESDGDRRGASYLVTHAHTRLSFYRRMDPGSAEGKAFRASITNDGMLSSAAWPAVEVGPAIANLQKMLDRAEFKDIELEWQSTKKALHRNPQWYSLFGGPRTIENLAAHHNLSAAYEVLYRFWSGTIHASSGALAVTGGPNKQAHVLPLRDPTSVQKVISFATSFSLRSFRATIKAFSPERGVSYAEWYVNFVRSEYLAVSSDDIVKIAYD